MQRIASASILVTLISPVVVLATPAQAPQAPDTAFHLANANPAFKSGQGPRVCIDVGHNNFQSAKRNPGAYKPLADLLEGDGYRVRESGGVFATGTLKDCDVLIVADAIADANLPNWYSFPHFSAFTGNEIMALDRWIRDGGGLLLIADHTPAPGAVAELGYRLGVVVQDGFARIRSDSSADVFARSRGEVVDHAIVRGRGPLERVDSVATFTGHAFWASREWSPLLKFGSEATGYLPDPGLTRAEWPHFSVTGWLQAGARRLGAGRVVWLGEVSACTALQGAVGMNHPSAGQNAQFCLSVNRWLSRVLDR